MTFPIQGFVSARLLRVNLHSMDLGEDIAGGVSARLSGIEQVLSTGAQDTMDLGALAPSQHFEIFEEMDFGKPVQTPVKKRRHAVSMPNNKDSGLVFEGETPKKFRGRRLRSTCEPISMSTNKDMGLVLEPQQIRGGRLRNVVRGSANTCRQRVCRQVGPVPASLAAEAFVAVVRRAMGVASFDVGGKVFLELCAGHGGFTLALMSLGFATVGIDKFLSFDHVATVDVAALWFVPLVVEWLSAKYLHGVGGGLPCHSFSRARRGRRLPGRQSGFPIALRSSCEPWGISGLAGPDLATLQRSNVVMRVALIILKACIIAGVKVWVENQASSLMWRLPEMIELTQLGQLGTFQIVTFDQCQFNAPFMKRTTIWFFNCNKFSPEVLGFRKCKFKRQGKGEPSFCPFMGKPHCWLTGFVGGKAVTLDFARYNSSLSLAIARVVRA